LIGLCQNRLGLTLDEILIRMVLSKNKLKDRENTPLSKKRIKKQNDVEFLKNGSKNNNEMRTLVVRRKLDLIERSSILIPN
jgi:hypothetical protein